jgi:phospholipid transport system substrate-binding protein
LQYNDKWRGALSFEHRGDVLINRRALLLTMASILAAPATVWAAGDAEQYVKSIGKDVLALANGSVRGKPLRVKFAGLLGRHVNLRTIAGSALGTFRSKMPERDKDKFNTLVTAYAAALFVWYIDKFKGADFVVDSVVQQGNFTIVKSKIAKSKISGEPIVWYLSPKGSGFQVVDLSILGVRLSVAMRDAFSRELKKSKGDFNSLYAFLAEAETW